MMVGGIYAIVYLAILVLGEIRLLGKQAEPANDIASRTSFSSVERSANIPLIQPILFLVMAITVCLGILVRASAAGWFMLFFFIPDVILTILHFVVQIRAIRRISEMKPSYVPLILLSNLFFFLGFALQVDFGDAPGTYVAILAFFSFNFNKHWALEQIPGDNLFEKFLLTSIGFLIALIVSWSLLNGKLLLKKENTD
jgi:hypothetical protein